jgi:hypothetical protein
MDTTRLGRTTVALQSEETAWQDWLARNRRNDEVRSIRRLRVGALVSPLALAAAFYWLFAR